MSFSLDSHELLQHLNAQGLKPTFDPASGQISVAFNVGGAEVPIFFVIRSESALLQTVAYLPYELSEKTLGNVARLLHLLNKELDMPGFGLDEKIHVIFYRAVIPCLNNQVNEQLLNLYLGTTKVACETFMQVIGKVLSGKMSVDEMLRQKPENG